MKLPQGQAAKLERLQKHKAKLEREDIIRELPMFESLSYQEIDTRKNLWSEYYKRVQGGKAAALYQSSRAALKRGDLQTVRDNGLKARKALAAGWEEDLCRPQFRDPYEFYNSGLVMSYRIVKTAIDELEGRVEKAPF